MFSSYGACVCVCFASFSTVNHASGVHGLRLQELFGLINLNKDGWRPTLRVLILKQTIVGQTLIINGVSIILEKPNIQYFLLYIVF